MVLYTNNDWEKCKIKSKKKKNTAKEKKKKLMAGRNNYEELYLGFDIENDMKFRE